VFSPDGQRIVTASDDETARVWNASSGQLLVTLQGHTGSVFSAEFSADSQRIVTASDDKTARVLRVVTLPEIAEFVSPENSVHPTAKSHRQANRRLNQLAACPSW